MNHHSNQARAALSRPGLICAAALLCLTAPAHAADNRGMIDLNGDKRISYEEFVHSAAARAIESMDADKNGMVNRSEAAAAARRAAEEARAPAPSAIPTSNAAPAPAPAPAPVPVTVTGADANGDGQVNIEELKKPLREHPVMIKAFNDLDRNKDGYLSPAELNGMDNNSRTQAVPQISVKF